MRIEVSNEEYNGRRHYVAAIKYKSHDGDGILNSHFELFITKAADSLDVFLMDLGGFISMAEQGERIPEQAGSECSNADLPDGWRAWRCGEIYLCHHRKHGFAPGWGNASCTDDEIEKNFEFMSYDDHWLVSWD
jgi:hypothetical protein